MWRRWEGSLASIDEGKRGRTRGWGRGGRKGRGGGDHTPWAGEGGIVTEGREGGREGGAVGGTGEKVTEELISKVHMQPQKVSFGICPPPLLEYIHLEQLTSKRRRGREEKEKGKVKGRAKGKRSPAKFRMQGACDGR